MICYKVVSQKYRYGTNATGYIAMYGFNRFKDKLRTHKALKQFFPIYKKGEIVKSVPGSIGILCFKTREHATLFISKYRQLSLDKNLRKRTIQPVEIIRVSGRNRRVVEHIMGGGMSLTALLVRRNDKDFPVPTGTICFESVKVID